MRRNLPRVDCARSPGWHADGFWNSMELSRRLSVILSLFVLGAAQKLAANPFPTRGPTVPGKVAQLRHGVACAPETAPLPVKRAI